MQLNPERFKTIVWHRRARKTTTAIYELVKQAFMRVGVYWHIFPTYSEAKDAVWRDPHMMFSFIPKEMIQKRNDSELVLTFVNGSVLQLMGADNPDTLRGSGPVGVVLDEFATMKFEAWQVIEPILRANGGWAWFIGTPKGKNHLWEFYQRGLQGHAEWKSFFMTADKSGLFLPDQLAETKKSMTQKMYAQEMMCDWLENEGTVFRSVREAMKSTVESPKDTHLYVIGCDLAKVTDFTVLTVYDRIHNNQVYQERFQTIEWPFQKQKIAALSRHYNNALVMLDATGLGDPIADDLIRIGVPVTPFKITEQTKKDLIEKLSIWIEQKKCLLLPLNETLDEFDNFSYEIGPTGKIRYQAREGYHDDIVLSHALAINGLNEVIKQLPTQDDTRLHQHFLNIKNQYSRGQIQDDFENT
jgi:phage FluMu gp28-like protein